MGLFTEDEVEIVRRHRFDTTGFIVADKGTCLDIQAEEVRRVRGHALRPLTTSTLPEKPLPASWMMAVILCPGDETRALARWAKGLPILDFDRIRFYENGPVSTRTAYAGWLAEGLPSTVLRFPVKDFKEFIVRFGQHLNQQILKDHRP